MGRAKATGSLLAILTTVLIGACDRPTGTDTKGNSTEHTGPAKEGEGEARVVEGLSPKEMLVGTWKRTVAIDDTRLEPYLERGGGYKMRVAREELLAELNEIVSTEATVEFRIDGVVVRTTEAPDGKKRTSRGQWKVLQEQGDRVEIETVFKSSMGMDSVASVHREEAVFHGQDRFLMQESWMRGKPLTAPVWDRVAQGSLKYDGADGNDVPPPFRTEPEPQDPEMAAKLEARGATVGLDGNGQIERVRFGPPPKKMGPRPDPQAVLPLLPSIPTLRSLRLPDRAIGDDDLAQVGKLTGLTRLALGYNDVTDAGLAHLSGLTKLEDLDLSATAISDQGMRHLRGLANLTSLDISHTSVGDDGLAHLAGLQRIERLDAGQTRVTGEGLVHLSAMTAMRWLSLRNTSVDDEGLAHLRAMRDLTHLDLLETGVTDAGMKHLAGLTGLRVLLLNNTRVGDAGVAYLKDLESLEMLYLNGTELTDAGLDSLKELKQLRRLYIDADNVTQHGAEDLQKALPDCVISHP